MPVHKGTKVRGFRRGRGGSALILTVVLTSLLAIVGVLFVMTSRVEKISSASVVQQRLLDLAIETLIEELSQQLVLDVPGLAGAEYHDYPGPEDPWLASLEPNEAGVWPQISDVTGYLAWRGWSVRNVAITDAAPGPFHAVIADHRPIALGPNEELLEQLADADGDGVADSKWFELDNVTGPQGRRVYAAVRVIDNCGMINANTAFQFDPYDPCESHVDGSSLLQINLMALAGPRGKPPRPQDANDLLQARANYGFGVDPFDLSAYEQSVIWNFEQPVGFYTPFDISDELELRYRFILNHADIDTRLESWGSEFRTGTLMTPVDSGGKDLTDWFKRVYDDGRLDPNYAYRHLVTTCSLDRVINAAGWKFNNGKMVNVNTADVGLLYEAIRRGLLDADPNLVNADAIAAQIAVNLVDFRDTDSSVTTWDAASARFYGFERPCIYISEIACHIRRDQSGTYRSYAVELFKPYFEDPDPAPGQWELVIDGTPIPVKWSGSRRFHVIRMEDPGATLAVSFNDPNEAAAAGRIGFNMSAYPRKAQDESGHIFVGGSVIYLQRKVAGVPVVVDSVLVPDANSVGGWLQPNTGPRSIQRDISLHKCIRRLWAKGGSARFPTLGRPNSYVDPDPAMVQAHPLDRPFRSIAELGMIFSINAYDDRLVSGCTEAAVRLDLRNPLFAHIFNYLTVIDPTAHGHSPTETRVKGRINVNTAPGFVLEQLPWMNVNPLIARAVVAYRDKGTVPGGPDYCGRPGRKGFVSIAALAAVPEMGFYADGTNPLTAGDQQGYPDLTYIQAWSEPRDGAPDDFEERDLILHRISNLVTVRSDVFTAYIMVRIGPDGPQRRVVAILDRSGVRSLGDHVRRLAVQLVPDPR